MDNKIHFLLRRINPENLKFLLGRELEDQLPCYYKKKYGDAGIGLYYYAVIDGVRDYVIYHYTKKQKFDYDIEEPIIKEALEDLFGKVIKDYYIESNCEDTL